MNEILQEVSFKENKIKQLPIIELYQKFNPKKAKSLFDCARWLLFSLQRNTQTQEQKHKLIKMITCKDRFCPFCTWRRLLKYRRLFANYLNKLHAERNARYIFLTLTVPNCHITELRETIFYMNKSFERFSKTKRFKGSILGFVRVLEYTIEKKRDNFIHPHFHCLLAISPSYFKGKKYINQKEYLSMWQKATRDNSINAVDVRIIKDKSKFKDSEGKLLPYGAVIAELIKYPLKDTDISRLHAEQFEILTQQLKNIRNINAGGILKGILKKIEIADEDLIHINDEDKKEFWEELAQYKYYFQTNKSTGELNYFLNNKK